jgi:hypothetical protein
VNLSLVGSGVYEIVQLRRQIDNQDTTHLTDAVPNPSAFLVENTKCVNPTCHPRRSTTTPLIMSNFLPKLDVLFSIGTVKSPNKSRDDRYQKMVPRCGFVTIFFELFQSRKNILPIFLLAFERNTRYATAETEFVTEVRLKNSRKNKLVLYYLINYQTLELLTFSVAIMTMEETVTSLTVVVEKSGRIHARREGSTIFSLIRFVICLAMNPKSTVYRVPIA